MKNPRILAAAIAVLFAGCDPMQYKGHSFDPLPPEKTIRIGYKQGDIDPAQYMIIGRGVLDLSIDIDIYDLEEALTDAARARGADAIGIVKDEIVTRGLREPFPEYKLEAPGEEPPPCPLNDMEKTAASFGDPIVLRGEKNGFISRKIYVVLWKDRKTAEPLIRKRLDLLHEKAAGIWNGENDVKTPETDVQTEPTGSIDPSVVPHPDGAPEKTESENVPANAEFPEATSAKKPDDSATASGITASGQTDPAKNPEPESKTEPEKKAEPADEKRSEPEHETEKAVNLPEKP